MKPILAGIVIIVVTAVAFVVAAINTLTREEWPAW
jgi:predicted small secreted protein